MLTLILISLTLAQGSPHWAEREQATAGLKQLLPASAPYLTWGRLNGEPEVAARSAALESWWLCETVDKKTALALARFGDQTPWIDSMPADWPCRIEIVPTYLGLARSEFGWDGSPKWNDYGHATKLYVKTLFRAGCGPTTVDDLLNAMAANQVKWIEENGKNFKPPLKLPKWKKE